MVREYGVLGVPDLTLRHVAGGAVVLSLAPRLQVLLAGRDLVTFPATRYIDTAGILLPAVPALAAVSLIEGLCAKRPPQPNEDANGRPK